MEGKRLRRGIIREKVVHGRPAGLPDGGVNGRSAHGIGQGQFQQVADGNANGIAAVVPDGKTAGITSLRAVGAAFIGSQIILEHGAGKGIQGLNGQADPTVFPYTALVFCQKGFQRHDGGTGRVAPQSPLSQVSEKTGTFDFTGQIHLVAIAHHRCLVFVFGSRRGVRRGEGQGWARPSRVEVSMPSTCISLKRLATRRGCADAGASVCLGEGLVRPANLIIPPFMLPFFPGAAPIKRMRSRGWLQCKKWKPSEPSH